MKHMKHVWANMPNRNNPAQPMKGNQLLMEGKQLLMKGDWALSPNWFHLGGWVWSGHPLGNNSHAYQVHGACDHIDAHGSRSCVWEQSGREHGGPHHLNGALILNQFWGNACYHPGLVIPMQGLCNFHKPWWGVMVVKGWCPPVLDPPPGLVLLVDLLSGW